MLNKVGVEMRLVTFQSMDALKYLVQNGELICDDKYIDIKKVGYAYEWILEKMNEKVKNNSDSKYPIWCWVKCYNGICPSKHKGEKVSGFDVKITFNKTRSEVFITDFRRYSFLLNNMYIPKDLEDKEKFDNELSKYNITKDELKAFVRPDKFLTHRDDKEFLRICDKIRKSFDRCITEDSDILQGCVWDIKLEEVVKIEILSDDGYRYGSLNYVRANGKRINWREDFYKKLK